MTDLRSEEYVSTKSHDHIRDMLLKVITSGNRWFVKSALDITPHEDERWDLCPGEGGGQVACRYVCCLRTPDLLNPNQVQRRLRAE